VYFIKSTAVNSVFGTFSEIHHNNFGYSYMGELVKRKEFEEFDKMTHMRLIIEENAKEVMNKKSKKSAFDFFKKSPKYKTKIPRNESGKPIMHVSTHFKELYNNDKEYWKSLLALDVAVAAEMEATQRLSFEYVKNQLLSVTARLQLLISLTMYLGE
jgi:hypothetical protein